MPRDTLTRQQIVTAAIELLDAHGFDGLSMRQLGERLSSAPTAVYWHVGSKDNLLVLAADEVWAEIDLPDPAVVGWRTATAEMARGLYDMVVRHSWLVPAMSTLLIYGAGKARHDDHLLGVYENAGFTRTDAARASQVVVTFVLGSALGATADAVWRTRMIRAGKADQVDESVAQAVQVAQQFPRLRDLAGALSDGDDFEFGLHAVLDGLQGRLT
ncbi:MAG TPA: TetR/AcrR family transcriptional regulator [Actinoplanes sp.]|nr:TetR/AcrR family transcriptional regulator [Actinoplanes sp.]